MMNGISSATLELLRNNNPFSSNAAAEPWSNSFPDIASINQKAFAGIRNLIGQKGQSPKMPLAGLVLGEAGDGKTHLLRRILKACQGSASPWLFVFVKPLFDSERPLHHLLQEIMLSLAKIFDDERGFTQFERLIAEIVRDYLRHHATKYPTPNNQNIREKIERDIFYTFRTKTDKLMPELLSYIRQQIPATGVNKEFLQVVLQYIDTKKRSMVFDWLKGSVLDDNEYNLLNVPSQQNFSDARMEQHAREVILALGFLFEHYRLPMVICFDQLDNLDQPQITGFAKMIHLLVNNAVNMLPLAFIRGDSWNNRFQNNSDKAFIDRLESNKFGLSGCTKDEAKELVSRRIEQIFGIENEAAVDMKTWLLPRLESKLIGLTSPREVIMFANRIIDDDTGSFPPPPPRPPSEIMGAEYEKACEEVAVEFDAWDPDSEYLKIAAEFFLRHHENVPCEPGHDKYMTWTGTLETLNAKIPYACFVNKAKNANAVLAALDRCKKFLENHFNGICTYITDARCDFKPTWKVATERREEVEALGGNIVILDQPAAVRWYGLTQLSLKIGSGDIRLEGEHGLRPATYEDLKDFLKTGFASYKTEGAFDRLLSKKKVVPSGKPQPDLPQVDELIQAMRNCLSESALPVLAMDVLLLKLREKGIEVTKEWCLEQIGKNQNVICLLSSRDGFIVKLVV